MGETFHWNHHHQKEDSSPVSEVPRGTRVSIRSLSSSLPASVIPCSPSGSCSLAAGAGTQPVECLPGIHGVWCSAPHGVSVVATACSANTGKVEARESDIQGHDWLYIASSKLPWTMWVWPLQKEGEEERREKEERGGRQTDRLWLQDSSSIEKDWLISCHRPDVLYIVSLVSKGPLECRRLGKHLSKYPNRFASLVRVTSLKR